jgi:ribosomal protein S18 acetylase RimI-like enzyme
VDITVRAIVEADWRQVRDLRLQALADTPHAFMETLLHAAEQTDEHWMQRARQAEEPDQCGFTAIDDRRWVGTMRGLAQPDGWTRLVGVFVAPSHRGRRLGVADALLDRVEEWSAEVGAPGVRLEVHERNERAQRLYLRRGYTFTGESQPYPLNESELELKMARPF